MPFSNMVQEMKGEIGAISRRCLPRPRGTGRVERVEPDEAALRESSWANVPPELMREVLKKVEVGEARWPGRAAVVASAGVCRGWRRAVKEMVLVPEASGKLTFPISVKQPGPRDAPLKCFIRRNRTTQSYFLCIGATDALSDDGKVLLAARKYRRPSCTEYLISLGSKGNGTYIGKLRAPRKMDCVMDSIPVSAIKEGGTAPTQTGFPSSASSSFASVPFFKAKSGQVDSSGTQLNSQNESKVALKNKSPSWNQQLRCWCLNFHGRVTAASVKNFQLVASDESAPTPSNQEGDDVILQFGKVGKDLFTMDYRYPISAFQAFAICLSSFETKIGCE
nr:unnamed protein product [Digitaria exilis]